MPPKPTIQVISYDLTSVVAYEGRRRAVSKGEREKLQGVATCVGCIGESYHIPSSYVLHPSLVSCAPNQAYQRPQGHNRLRYNALKAQCVLNRLFRWIHIQFQ